MQKVIDSSLEVFDQLISFIDSIDDDIYQTHSRPLFDSNIGQHLRHILDIYQALIRNKQDTIIDYDIRLRGIPLESNRRDAIITLNTIRQWLTQLTPDDMNRSVSISTEVAISEQHSAIFQTSFGRELFFASNHTIHHLALMVTLAKVLGWRGINEYGVAPATATYLREQESAQNQPDRVS